METSLLRNKQGRALLISIVIVLMIAVFILMSFSLVSISKKDSGFGQVSVQPLTSFVHGFSGGAGAFVTHYDFDDDDDDDDDSSGGGGSTDTTAPATISSLALASKGTDFLNWSWTNPTDSDFANNIIYFDGLNVQNTTNNFYNATGLTANTAHTITINTIDSSGNINTVNVSDTQMTDTIGGGDTTPPGNVTGLGETSVTSSTITWGWTNPTDSDFAQNLIFIDGTNVLNTSASSYTATGLSASTSYTITVQTTDTSGNINTPGVSDAAVTSGSGGGGNAIPVVSGIPDVIFAEDGSDSSIDLDGFVSDADHTDAEMTWTFSGNSNISVTISSGNVVTFTATLNWNGNEFITFRATDPVGAFDEDTISVTITPVDDAAVWAVLTNQNVDEDSPDGTVVYSNIVGQCTDVDSSVSVSVISSSSNFDLSIIGNDLTIENLLQDWFGTEEVFVSCNSVSDSFDLTVNQLNDDCVTICSFGSCYTYCA